MKNYDEQTRYVASVMIRSALEDELRIVKRIIRKHSNDGSDVPQPNLYRMLLDEFLPMAERLVLGGEVKLDNVVYRIQGESVTKTQRIAPSASYLGNKGMESVNTKYFFQKVTATYLMLGGSLKAAHEELYGIISEQRDEASRLNELMLKLRLINDGGNPFDGLIWLGDGYYYTPMAKPRVGGCVFNGQDWVTFFCHVEDSDLHFQIAKDIKQVLIGSELHSS